MVLPLEAGIGLVPQSAAKDAFDFSRSGFPPAVINSCAAVTVPDEHFVEMPPASSAVVSPGPDAPGADRLACHIDPGSTIIRSRRARGERLEHPHALRDDHPR